MLQQAEDTLPMTQQEFTTKRWHVNEKDTVIGARSIATTRASICQAGVQSNHWNRQAGTNLTELRSERSNKKRRSALAYESHRGLQPSVHEDKVGLGGRYPAYSPRSTSFSLGESSSKPTRGRSLSTSPSTSASCVSPTLASTTGSGGGVRSVRGTDDLHLTGNTYTEHVVVEGAPWKLAREGADLGDEGNYLICSICKDTGKLIYCDACPQAFHDRCLEVCTDSQIAAQYQEGLDRWYCPSCTSGTKINNAVAGVNFASSKPHKAVSFASITPAAGASAAAGLSAGLRSPNFVRDHHRGTKRRLPDAEQRCMISPWLMNCDGMATSTGSERTRLDEAAERQTAQRMLHGETVRPIASRQEDRKELRLPYAAAPAFIPATYNDNSRDNDTGTTCAKGTKPITPCFPPSRTDMVFPRSAQLPSAPVSSTPFTRRNATMGRTFPGCQPGNPVMDQDDLSILASVSLAPEVWAAGMRGSLQGVPPVRAGHVPGGRRDVVHGAGVRADGGGRVSEMNGSHPARTRGSARNSRVKPRLGKKDSVRKENRVWNRRHMRATQEGEIEVCSYCGDHPEGGLMVCSARKVRNVHTVCFPCLENDGITTSDLARGRVKWKGCLKCDELPYRRCSGRSRSKPQRFHGGFVDSGGEV